MTYGDIVCVDVVRPLLPSNGAQFDPEVIECNNIIVSVLGHVVWCGGDIAGEPRVHIDGAKFFQEQLVVIGPHH